MAMIVGLDDARRRGSGFRAISALLPRDHLWRRVDRLPERQALEHRAFRKRIGAAVLNLLLLARPADQRPRRDRTDVVPLPPSIMGRVIRGMSENARYAPVSLNS
ncbi:hypothetical protein [Rhizorhapis sp. SPR117]|uniref:hypothetical protein n=1 Tax=Rhizorhapis sp. SPR117 TaxID=2912611 RepID=UPI001F3AD12F|nr:hypothetical protein [Rhizorhapis sp. SPR117]